MHEYAGIQTFPVDRKHSDCSKALRNPQKVDLCVLASFSCRVYAETHGRKVRPVAGFRLVTQQIHCHFPPSPPSPSPPSLPLPPSPPSPSSPPSPPSPPLPFPPSPSRPSLPSLPPSPPYLPPFLPPSITLQYNHTI